MASHFDKYFRLVEQAKCPTEVVRSPFSHKLDGVGAGRKKGYKKAERYRSPPLLQYYCFPPNWPTNADTAIIYRVFPRNSRSPLMRTPSVTRRFGGHRVNSALFGATVAMKTKKKWRRAREYVNMAESAGVGKHGRKRGSRKTWEKGGSRRTW